MRVSVFYMAIHICQNSQTCTAKSGILLVCNYIAYQYVNSISQVLKKHEATLPKIYGINSKVSTSMKVRTKNKTKLGAELGIQYAFICGRGNICVSYRQKNISQKIPKENVIAIASRERRRVADVIIYHAFSGLSAMYIFKRLLIGEVRTLWNFTEGIANPLVRCWKILPLKGYT